MSKEKIRILIIHPDLKIGGAETQVKHLIEQWSNNEQLHLTLVLYDALDEAREKLTSLYGIPVVDLERRTRGRIRSFLYLLSLWRNSVVDIVYTLLEGPNLVAALLALNRPNTKVIWGNRVSSFRYSDFGIKSWIIQKLLRVLANRVDLIISNSEAGRTGQMTRKIIAKKHVVILNGIDTEIYRKDPYLRDEFRSELGVSDQEHLIGIVARVVEWKGYEFFLRSAALFLERFPNFRSRFICIGDGKRTIVTAFKNLTDELNIGEHVVWLGARHDVHIALSGLDVVSSLSKRGEGFSNAIGEAMASEAAIVATDVGENRRVIGDSGVIIEPEDTDALLSAWRELLANPSYRSALGKRARQRVVERFSVDKMEENTRRAFISIVR